MFFSNFVNGTVDEQDFKMQHAAKLNSGSRSYCRIGSKQHRHDCVGDGVVSLPKTANVLLSHRRGKAFVSE